MEKGCPGCGRMIDATKQICPYCNYDFNDLSNIVNKYEKERLKMYRQPKYAGFIKRTVATSLDLFLWTFIFSCITLIYTTINNQNIILNEIVDIKEILPILIIWLFMPICYFIYCVFRQYTKNFATIGEKLVGIEVVNEKEEPITLKMALTHNLARILNILTFGIGYLIIIFTKKKQALSDIISKTYVINKATKEDYSNFRYAHPISRLIAFIIDISSLILAFYVYKNIQTLLPESNFKAIIVTILDIIFIIFLIVYSPYMESHYGATLGKRVLGIKITKINGEKASFIKSTIRTLLITFELMIPLSSLLSFVTPRRQTLKDIITKTTVINNR